MAARWLENRRRLGMCHICKGRAVQRDLCQAHLERDRELSREYSRKYRTQRRLERIRAGLSKISASADTPGLCRICGQPTRVYRFKPAKLCDACERMGRWNHVVG